jgi:hypothetical protein
MSDETKPVRPTKVCIDALDLSVPTVDVPLPLVGHDLINEAQRVPDAHAAGGVERILVLSDRLWFKVKTGRWRGAATRLARSEGPADSSLAELASWWLGTGGYRREGSPEDFYARLTATARRDGNSDRWIPSNWDWNRLKIEAAYAWERKIREVVCQLIARSLRDGRAHQANLHDYTVTALAKATAGETYLLVGTSNVADPRIFAVILNAVPGVDRDSWLPEPDRVEDLRPGPGEVVWSTILPPSAATDLLEAFADD